MKKKRIKVNSSKLRGICYLTVAIILMLVLLGKFNDVVISAKEEINDLEDQKVDVLAEEAKLTEELSLLDNEDYVTTYAREHYVFKSDDETVVQITDSNENSTEDSTEDNQ